MVSSKGIKFGLRGLAAAAVLSVGLLVGTTGSAYAQHYHGGGGGFHGGGFHGGGWGGHVFIGGYGFGPWSYYGYDPYYYYPPPVAYAPPPVAYAQPPTAPAYDQSFCRNYQTTVVVDGVSQPTSGVACRQPDGTWRIVQ